MIDENVKSRMRRIAVNLYLDWDEKQKFLDMYHNSDPKNRDYVLMNIEKESESRNFEVRRKLRDKIRNS